jgi:hypothetical protein
MDRRWYVLFFVRRQNMASGNTSKGLGFEEPGFAWEGRMEADHVVLLTYNGTFGVL